MYLKTYNNIYYFKIYNNMNYIKVINNKKGIVVSLVLFYCTGQKVVVQLKYLSSTVLLVLCCTV